MTKIFIILFTAFSLTLGGCATVFNPATGRKELIFITTPAEVSIGDAIASKYSTELKISKDEQKIKRVTDIGTKIAEISDRKGLRYHFIVVEDETLNAFTIPGGYVYVNSGVMDKSTDDELACVIGHEIGHVAARHTVKKLQAQIGYEILMNIAAAGGSSSSLQRVASVGYNLVALGYSREDEFAADELGAKYAHKAGYDPYGMISFLKKIEETKEEQLGFIFLRSHPYTSQRIKTLEQQIPLMINKVDNAAPFDSKKRKLLRVMCPDCKKTFSANVTYCPYDGSKLR
jgi:predicted Zn-dependent protease